MASIFEAALLFGIVVRPAICIPHALYMAAGLPARDINTSMAHNFRGDGSRNGLQLLQTKSGTKRRQAVTFRSAELDLASQVGLSQEGYASVLSMHNEEQTVTFVRRVIAKFNATVTDDGSLAGIVPFYTGKFDNTPTFSDLTRELATATWLTGFRGASTASLDEEGYHSVADMLNDDQMRAYIRRVIAAHGGREAAGRLSIPGKFVCADCPRLFGMARRYSGTESRQSYKALVSELRSTDWLEGVNESQVAKLEHDPARMRLASTRCDDCEESLLYIGVFSAPYNWKRRDDVRRSWMQDGIFGGPKPRVKAKFIIGRTDNHSLNFVRTHAKGSWGITAKSIVSLPELLPPQASGAALLNTEDSEVVTYSALRAYLISHQTALALPPGLRIAIVLPTGPSLACVLLATMHRGIAVPLDPAMTEQELTTACEHLKVQAMICLADDRGQTASTVAANCGLGVIYCETSKDGPCPRLRLASGISAPTLPGKPWRADDEERVVLMLRTSGTTSKGKVVPLSFRQLARAAQYNAACIGLRPGHVCLSMMPFYHISGIHMILLPSIFAGATVLVVGRSFDAKHFVQQLEGRGEGRTPTWYFAVPSVHATVIHAVQSRGRPLRHELRLVRNAGAALDPALGRKLLSLFGAAVTPTYGMTETCGLTSPPMDYQLERVGSVGPSISCEIKIDCDKDPASGTGEICVKGDVVMKGYEWDGAPEDDPNIEAWTDEGYFRTGDVGYLDSEGWLYITGRSKEMINRGGETLSPYEVEEVVQSLSTVSFCLAFAAPHASLGECIAIACVLNDGVTPWDMPLRTLLEECTARGLRPVMRPEVVVYCPRNALPQTRTGKFIRAGLARKFGFRANMLETCRAFRWSGGVLEPLPEADLAQDASVLLQDSMGHLRSATRVEYVTQNVVNSLYGICIVHVMLNHWLPHNLNDYPIPDWANVTLTAFRSDKALMSLVFVLGGYSAASWDKDSFGRRICILLAIYILMGWPKLFESTQAVATFHRWYIYWLVFCIMFCQACDALHVPGFAVAAAAIACAPLFAQVPDNLGSLIVPQAPFVMDPYHFWSMGHKLYWLGLFCIGYYYGHLVPEGVARAPSRVRDQLQNVPMRLLSLALAAGIALASATLDVPYDDSLEEGLADWPYFFSSAYPIKMLCEWLQLAFLVVSVQQGGPVMQTVGASILGTFILHMYLDIGLKTFAESYVFQTLDFAPIIGGLLQLAIVFAYPVVFALTVGRLGMFLIICLFTRHRPGKGV